MDEKRKKAYQALLYYALIEIRMLSGIYYANNWWNPLNWTRYRKCVKDINQIADALHNLASFLRKDGMEGFDETYFWKAIDAYGDTLKNVRSNFEQELSRLRE